MKRNRKDDLALVRQIVAGSDEAWQRFILRYSGLIYSVARRYLFDDEEVQNVYVEVLERLYHGKLESFEGRSALSTWLVLVSRNVTLDFLRKRFGRRNLPGSVQRLSRRDQQIFRLYYVEGMSFDAVRHWVGGRKEPLSASDLAAALRRIHEKVDSRVLQRIAFDLHAPSVGAASGRMMEFLEWHRATQEARRQRRTPEHDLLQKEAARLAERVQEVRQRLPDEERRVLDLRFDRGWTAAHIAEEMGLESSRRAYTLIDRAIRNIRSLLGIQRAPKEMR